MNEVHVVSSRPATDTIEDWQKPTGGRAAYTGTGVDRFVQLDSIIVVHGIVPITVCSWINPAVGIEDGGIPRSIWPGFNDEYGMAAAAELQNN